MNAEKLLYNMALAALLKEAGAMAVPAALGARPSPNAIPLPKVSAPAMPAPGITGAAGVS